MYIHYIVLSLILYGFTATIDRTLLGYYDFQPVAYIVFAHVFLAFHFLIMMHLFHDGMKGVRHGLKSAGWWILLVAVFTVGYRLARLGFGHKEDLRSFCHAYWRRTVPREEPPEEGDGMHSHDRGSFPHSSMKTI